jgi:HYR domain
MKNRNQHQRWAILFTLLVGISQYAQAQLFIAKNGNDSNDGTIGSPLATLIGARDRARATGIKTVWIRGGRYDADTTCNLTEQDAGMKFSGYANEKVIFDGAKYVNPDSFSIVTDATTLTKLHSSGIGKVYAQTITDASLITILSQSSSQISMDDKMMIIARFPNLGYGHILDNTASGEQVNQKGDETNPKGAQFKIRESFDAAKWNAEITRHKRAYIKGYISADWLKETIAIFSVGTDGIIKLMDGSRYGIKVRGGSPNRLFALQLLCELDEPGEWFFDPIDKKLFIWPYQPIDSLSKVGVWAGTRVFNIASSNDVKIQKMTIQNLGRGTYGDGAIDIRNSTNCEVAGVILRYINYPLSPINIYDGSNCGIVSCDFSDHEIGVRCYGGKARSTSITYGNHYVQNCHFTQIYSKDFYGKAIAINGAGNTFRNNLVHNTNGQPITHAGVDHLFERNEVFNVGIEEGDGGAFYTGAAIWSHGNVIRHNFVHHIMSVPKLLGRAAFFSDDYDGGETVAENVLYKGGWEAIKMNKGAGHTILKNVLLECYTGIRNGDGTISDYNTAMGYITNNNPTADEKPNYIGRMLNAIGKPDWRVGLTVDNWSDRLEGFWTSRYPFLKTVVDKYNVANQMKNYECRFYNNLFYGNTTNINGGPTVVVQGSQTITLGLFADPKNLNFKFIEPRPSYAPDIPFENIGLYKDDYRCAVPDKDTYRRNIKSRFAGQAAHTGDAYDFATINQRLYYNTGKMIMDLLPCYEGNETVAADEYKFDAGTAISPVFEGYIGISHFTSGTNYGWTNTSDLDSRDRGNANGTNNLNRDFVFSSAAKTFEAKVTPGTWKVLLTFGDLSFPHDNMQVKVEGEIKLTNLSTAAGQFINQEFNIDVLDDRLSIEFSDQGGADRNWIVNLIGLTKLGPLPVTLNNDAGICGAAFAVEVPKFSSNPSASVQGVRSDALPLTAAYPVGKTTIIWTGTATDGSGKISTGTQTITVNDVEAPVLAVGRAVSVPNDAGVCAAMINITTATATDNCSVPVLKSSRSDGLLLTDAYPVGETTITWTATDAAGNTATATQAVTVNDTEAPVLAVGQAIAVPNDVGTCAAMVSIGAAIAIDNCSGTAVKGSRSDGLLLTDAYPVGKTIITWTATDSLGNTATTTQAVMVNDVEAPVLTVGHAISVPNDAGVCGAMINITTATATDNCSVPVLKSVRSDGQPLTAVYPVGNTTITWMAADSTGNTAIATQAVTVNDVEAPVLTVGQAISVPNDAGVCGASINITATAADNCPGSSKKSAQRWVALDGYLPSGRDHHHLDSHGCFGQYRHRHTSRNGERYRGTSACGRPSHFSVQRCGGLWGSDKYINRYGHG